MWDPIRRGLEPRWRVLTPDLPGHGSRRNETFTLDAAVQTMTNLVRSAAPAPVVVGGDSLGGYVSLASAAALPGEQLKGLVLSGSSANFNGAALRALERKWLGIRVMSALLSEKFVTSQVAKELRKMGVEARDVESIVAAGLNSRVFGQCVEALRGIDFRAKVAAVEQPVLVVNGSKDKIFVDQEDAFVAAARQPTRHRIEGFDHGVSLRCAAEFTRLVDGFAERVLGAAPPRTTSAAA